MPIIVDELGKVAILLEWVPGMRRVENIHRVVILALVRDVHDLTDADLSCLALLDNLLVLVLYLVDVTFLADGPHPKVESRREISSTSEFLVIKYFEGVASDWWDCNMPLKLVVILLSLPSRELLPIFNIMVGQPMVKRMLHSDSVGSIALNADFLQLVNVVFV